MADHNPRAAAGDKRAVDTSDSANIDTAPPKRQKIRARPLHTSTRQRGHRAKRMEEVAAKKLKEIQEQAAEEAPKAQIQPQDPSDISAGTNTAQPMDGDLDPNTAIGIPTEEVRDWVRAQISGMRGGTLASKQKKEAKRMAAQKEKEAKQMAAQKLMDDARAASSRGGSSRRQMLEAKVAQLSNELDAGHAQFVRDIEYHATHDGTGLTGLVAAARMDYDKAFGDRAARTGGDAPAWDGSAPLKACGGSLDDGPLDVDMADDGEVDYNTILSGAAGLGGLSSSSTSPKFPGSSLDVEDGASAVWFKDSYGQVTHEDRVPIYDRPAYKFPIGAPADFWKKFQVDDESDHGLRENLKAAPASRSVWFGKRGNRGGHGRGRGHGGGLGRSRRGR